MPWSSNADLPKQVRAKLSDHQQTVFRRVVNAALTRGKTEQSAFRMAWSAAQGQGKRVSTLYLQRKLLNADQLVEWAKAKGCEKVLDPDEMHVTIAYSKDPVEWPDALLTDSLTAYGDERTVTGLGPNGDAVVLKFKHPQLTSRWDDMRVQGASWDFESYMPHITISYSGADQHLLNEEPYEGPLVLGPEIASEVNEDWKDTVTEKQIIAKVSEVNDELGVVFGWAIISKIDDVPYFDLQGDYIPEDTMLKSAAEFMAGDRTAGDMHTWKDDAPHKVGTVVFAFPLTAEISKAMKIQSDQTGLMLGMKVDDTAILQKFKTGEYTGFSIGGYRIDDEEVVDGEDATA